jgi:hypothetical protein
MLVHLVMSNITSLKVAYVSSIHHHVSFRDPEISSASVVRTDNFARPPCCYYWVQVAKNLSLRGLMQVYQQIQKFNGDIQRI